MKKLIICFSFVLAVLTISAQNTSNDSVLRSKKGIPILPQKGDWAIGADASPYLSYLGNIFNNSSDNGLDLSENTLYGRYYLSDNTALRISLYMNNYSNISRQYVQDDAAISANPLSNAKVEDTYKTLYSSNSIDIAYLKFRGYGRLKGYYGVQFGLGYSRTRYEYAYGNEMTVANANPTSYWDGSADQTRLLKSDNGLTKSLNLGLVAGVEFYFAPKICIGTEMVLYGYHNWRSQGDAHYQHVNGSLVEEYDIASTPAGRTSTGLYTYYAANFNGSLYVMFHF